MELESAELRFGTDAAGQPTNVTVKQARPCVQPCCVLGACWVFATQLVVAACIASVVNQGTLRIKHSLPLSP